MNISGAAGVRPTFPFSLLFVRLNRRILIMNDLPQKKMLMQKPRRTGQGMAN
jgi:hypothetical protein